VAEIHLDMGAYTYSEGLKAIGLMYHAARGALSEQRTDLDAMAREYDRHTESGGTPIGEWDEEGNRLWDQEDHYRLQQLVIDDAMEELKAATVIAIYHHWERSIPFSSDSTQRRHDELKKDAHAQNIALHPDIDALCFCANYFKHGSVKWLKKLVDRWPDRFHASHIEGESLAWHRRLTFESAEIEWFVRIAEASKRPICAKSFTP
jgi:hypothetical protein